MTRAGPAWLAELQAQIGQVLRTPLDRTRGTLEATPSAYDARAVARVASGAHGLAVYNRQYWFRLFETFLDAFPLTSSLLGAWSFHAHSGRFLQTSPPRDWDLERCTDGFAAFFAEHLEAGPERTLLVESVHVDDAWLRVFRAPTVTPFRPSAADAARLLDAHLVASPAVIRVEEHAPLVALRRTLGRVRGAGRLAMPDAHAEPHHWAIVRNDAGLRALEIESREVELLDALAEHSVRDALALVERRCSAEERSTLPARARTWLARGIEHGFWSGLRFVG